MEKHCEMRKSKFITILEKINNESACNCPFEVIDSVADEIFSGNESIEYDIEFIVEKMKVSLDHGMVFSKLLIVNKQIESLKNFLETKILAMMKFNKCELNYDILSQLRDRFVTNTRYKQMFFDSLFKN